MLPNLIFIIGPSCSGKSSMSQIISRLHPEYSVLDDVVPLYKIFNADILLHQNKLPEFWNYVKSNNLDLYYRQENPLPYSHPNPQGGFLIDNPMVWNVVLAILSNQIVSDYNIVEFSRGNDIKYNQFFKINNKDVYPLSFDCLCHNISEPVLKKSLILNIDSPIDVRKQRNIERYKNGGHLVSENTMDTVYKENIFSAKNSFIKIRGIKVPVIFINNQNNCSNFPLFLQNEFLDALNYYRRYHNELQ